MTHMDDQLAKHIKEMIRKITPKLLRDHLDGERGDQDRMIGRYEDREDDP